MYFAPPARIEAEVFTTLPDAWRQPKDNAWTRTNARGRQVHSVLEGVVFDRDGQLYVTDVPQGRIFRISPAGQWSLVAEYDGWPNGLAIHRDGRIFVADYRHGILLLDAVRGTVAPVVDTYLSEGFRGVNDLFFDSRGDLYFTDQGQSGLQDPSGRVFRYSAQGVLTRLLDRIPSPNGLVVDDRQGVLYVAVTRAQQVWRAPLHDNGETSKVGVFAQLHGGPGGPDGLALGEDGALFIAHAGFGSVWHLDRYGQPLHRIASPVGRSVTNLAFGGPDWRTLFVSDSESGSLLRAPSPVAGLVPYSHAREVT